MYETTIAGCVFLTMTYLSCLQNPLQEEYIGDATTFATRIIGLSENYYGEISYDMDVWPGLREIFTPGNNYNCEGGLCLGILQGDTPKNVQNGIINSTGLRRNITRKFQHDKNIVFTTPSEPISNTLIGKLLLKDIEGGRFSHEFSTQPTNHVVTSRVNPIPFPPLSPEETQNEDSKLEDIILKASTGIFSLTTFLAFIKCVCKHDRCFRCFRWCTRVCCIPPAQTDQDGPLINIDMQPPIQDQPRAVVYYNETFNLNPQSDLENEGGDSTALNAKRESSTQEKVIETKPKSLRTNHVEDLMDLLIPPAENIECANLQSTPDQPIPQTFKSTVQILTKEFKEVILKVDGENCDSTGMITPLTQFLPDSERLRRITSTFPKPNIIKRLHFTDSFFKESPV